MRLGMPPIVSVICGLSTATFGGVTRDVLMRRPPRILHSYAELYATTAITGSIVYLAARAAALPVAARIVSCVLTVTAMRWYAWSFNATLPVWDASKLNKT